MQDHTAPLEPALPAAVSGPRVDVAAMAEARERRVRMQETLILSHRVPVISFTLNIAGPVKVFPLSVRSFEEGVRRIEEQLSAFRVRVPERKILREPTGCEAFWAADAGLPQLKTLLCDLEENLSIGRLFDIDVIGVNGEKLSRTSLGFPERTCLICGRPAFVCGRARAHSLYDLLDKSCGLMQEFFDKSTAARLSSLSMQALLYEVSTTPKPGLVDRNNNGSHRDMDIFTFEASAVSLNRWFSRFALCGMRNAAEPPERIFSRLRSLGIAAEADMFRATGGVNTHKGLIFALALMNCALGRMSRTGTPYSRETLSGEIRLIAGAVRADFDGLTETTAETAGETLYLSGGSGGARGEALSGYRTVFQTALPVMDQCFRAGASANEAGAVTLLHILSETEDSNLVKRSSVAEMQEIRAEVAAFLNSGAEAPPAVTEDRIPALLSYAEALDRDFIRRNLSPGGSADLLALCFFVHLYEESAAGENPVRETAPENSGLDSDPGPAYA